MESKLQNETSEKKQSLIQKTWFLVLMCILFPPIGIAILWIAERPSNIKVRAALTGVLVLYMIIAIAVSGDSDNAVKKEEQVVTEEAQHEESKLEEPKQEESVQDPSEAPKAEEDGRGDLRKELEEKYDVSEPSRFVRGDATGNWRIVKVANLTDPSDYALEYAKAYMMDSEETTNIHFIVNFSLKTTTRFRIISGILEVKTTEYVDKEEHDAKIIGEGEILSKKNFDLESGKEITTDVDKNAGNVDSDKLVSKVKKVIKDA
ncbi:MAG: hypothetical protein K6G65_04940, partial [Lachnospiraceae bacterium]|nr:hypothetical protein [Lachnospiraceae bacterium]